MTTRQKKKCTAEGCEERIPVRHSFCKKCFSSLPFHIRNDLLTAYRRGDGQLMMKTNERARQMFRDRNKPPRELKNWYEKDD